jgi:DNA polymerase-3 subunit epsilon
VHPDVFDTMLAHLQPAVERLAAAPVERKIRLAADLALTPAADGAAAPAASPAMVRAWALRNGHEVGTRGRIHADIWAAYAAANSASSPEVADGRAVDLV